MSVWQIILLAWMAYQLFTVFRAYFNGTKSGASTAANVAALVIGVGLWASLFVAMLQCGLLDGIQAGRIRIN